MSRVVANEHSKRKRKKEERSDYALACVYYAANIEAVGNDDDDDYASYCEIKEQPKVIKPQPPSTE